MEDSLKVGRLAILESGLELDFLRGLNRCFIESMAQSLHNSLDANLTIRGKQNFQQNFAFDFEASPFFSVNRAGLESDLGRYRSCNGLGCFGFGRRRRNYVSITKSALADGSPRGRNATGIVSSSNAISESSAGDHAF